MRYVPLLIGLIELSTFIANHQHEAARPSLNFVDIFRITRDTRRDVTGQRRVDVQ